MTFCETTIPGVIIVEWVPHCDERGFFARLHCPRTFAAAGHPFVPIQTSLSRNIAEGTLRGLHWQDPPYAEAKLVRVTRGRVFDVAVDLRQNSPTFKSWLGFELDAEGGRALLIPEGIAHGFLTLAPETDVLYHIATDYAPGHAKGARWNDPAFGIVWPREPRVMSERDCTYESYSG